MRMMFMRFGLNVPSRVPLFTGIGGVRAGGVRAYASTGGAAPKLPHQFTTESSKQRAVKGLLANATWIGVACWYWLENDDRKSSSPSHRTDDKLVKASSNRKSGPIGT